jgi:hypothetical protein
MKPIERRLAAVEQRLEQLRPEPPGVIPWVEFCTGDELDALEAIAYAIEVEDRELTEDEERRWLAVEAAALSRELAGWPKFLKDPERYHQVEQALARSPGPTTCRPR